MATFDVEASQSLTPIQYRNRQLAVERVVEQLRAALRVERRRRATKPSAQAVERRLEDKRRRSRTKRLRRPPDS